ncbi:3-phenylpropionate/trans-cinnamate dioxygenase ferredoxin reductase subunit [Gemmobacter aquatilis]|uniref:3-phenylpropionate/trans-cinnamate dioxygenase ferredoxin reductase subunit n=1 Tax=Gemmobacter aquatilis TaxID=933059 RepID=A0A1H8L619_9RHOB|nr:FAD-dependent oxidoreductase [Gemmobacter aquatilis]SEO00577.1 3-phenylpropionate/trans-cinnamate dioxygenase ferredoxin reductase subunit [Gemmobacter aquatilis]
MAHFVVIGAGQAGASLVAKLRSAGFAGDITLIGEESAPPYQRPPLSKAYLLGEMELERLYLRSPEFYAENHISLRLGQPVTAIDAQAKTVTVGGEVLSYDELALTTGSTPRRLPAAIGGDLAGVYTVRSLADVDAMRDEFAPGRSVVIIGGGYIGLEAAAVAAKLGLKATVVEMAPRILQRVAAPETSAYFRALHTSHGVEILEGVGLDRLLGEGRVTAARLTDGRELKADFVIAGVGILPVTALAEAAGCALDNGIRTDAQGRTSQPHIWAAGDCASFPWGEGRLRLESVGNAIDQAEVVAENMLGAGKAYVAQPWFWSDQYDCKLQIAGLNTGYDHIVTRQGSGAAVSFWYYQGPRLLAVDAMNDPRAYMVGKRLIEMGRSPDPVAIADPATELKALLKA